MNELIKSCDYARLADLIEQGTRIPVGRIKDGKDFWFGCARYIEACYDGGNYHYLATDMDGVGAYVYEKDKAKARAAFIERCEAYGFFFIDPASQCGGDELWRSTDLLRDALKRMKPGGGLYRSIEAQIEENEKRMGSES